MKVYVDTSVFGGVFDKGYIFCSKWFFTQVASGHILLVTSRLVETEISRAPSQVQEVYATARRNAEFVTLKEPALELRQAYLDANIITPKSRDDATHVALASVSQCDIIASWNFKHIVNEDKIPQYNAVNIIRGYNHLKILSPKEVMDL